MWKGEEFCVPIVVTFKLLITMPIKDSKIRNIITRFDHVFYPIAFIVFPLGFYLIIHFEYLLGDIADKDLPIYLESEKRYSVATRIWLLEIIVILLLIL